MNSGYVALSMPMCDLLPLAQLMQSIFTGIRIKKDQKTLSAI